MADPGRRIDLPNGSALYYVEEDHSYWRCKPDGSRGRRLTGLTGVIKPIDFRPDNLMRWAAKLNGEGIAELCGPILAATNTDSIPDALAWLDSADSIWQALEDAELTYNHIRDRAAQRGTNVHELALRALAEGKPVPDFDSMSDEEKGYAQGVVKFWLDHDPEPLDVEQIVADEELGVAGRFDLRAKLSTYDGIGLIDAKTSAYISEGAHVQIAGYRFLAEACGVGETDYGAILRLSEDGDYELIDVQAEATDFLAAVDCYRRAARIKSAAGKARREKALA